MKNSILTLLLLLSSLCSYGQSVSGVASIDSNDDNDFRIAAVGDVQVNDSTELSYAARTIFSELSNRQDIDFAMYLGDLVNDDTGLLSAVASELDLMPHPSWTLPGNHDLDRGKVRRPDTYSDVFGQTDYAFNKGNTLFIALDNVTVTGEDKKYGELSESQLRFIANNLALSPKASNVVLSLHIPVSRDEYARKLDTLLADRPRVLILAGHTHTTSRHILASNACELVVGASCGSWWTGEKTPDGVPLSLQRCGTPRNYYIIDFSDSGYSIAFKGIGLDERTSMDVWVKGEEITDREIEALQKLPDGCIVANIYGGSDASTVEMSIDGGVWITMEHSPMQAPMVSRIIYWNGNAGYPTKFSRRTPFPKSSLSPHIWMGTLPADLPPGAHSIEIRAADNFGFETSYTRQFIKR